MLPIYLLKFSKTIIDFNPRTKQNGNVGARCIVPIGDIRQQNSKGTIHCAPTNWERWIPAGVYDYESGCGNDPSDTRLHRTGKNNISLKGTALGDGTLIISV